jgi:hypothetical protein
MPIQTAAIDFEMLALAAKPAGITLRDNWGNFLEVDERGCCHCWFPLTNDAQALRLAVHIGFIVNAPSPIGTHATVKFYDVEVSEPVHSCRLAATRRAIVRAAAEIGKLS